MRRVIFIVFSELIPHYSSVGYALTQLLELVRSSIALRHEISL